MSAGTSPAIDRVSRTNPWATGFALTAGVFMVVSGVSQALVGIAAIANDEVYLPVDGYTYGVDLTAWGWIHLVFGIVVLLTGFAVVRGRDWARAVGIGLVSLSMIANFLFIPYYPLWSLLLIALDAVVIWALAATSGRQGY
jgi:hypothetical protein